MSKPAARMLDQAGHGGAIAMGEFTVLINGMPAARVGDPLICPGFNGPIPHIMGNIVMGSTTVMIGGGFAARATDQTGCGIAGLVAMKLAPLLGPPAFTNPPPPPPPPPRAEQQAAANLGPVDFLAASHTDTSNSNGDGANDSFSLVQAQGETEILGQTITGSYRLGNIDTTYSTNSLGEVTSAYAQVSTHQVQVSRSDALGNSDTITITGPNAQVGADTLVGMDNRRTGVLVGASAQASLGEIQYDQTRDTVIPFTNHSIRVTKTAGIEVGGAGGQYRAGVFHDSQDNRIHGTLLGSVEAALGLKLGIDVSIGEVAVPTVSILGIGIPLIPGVIAKGSKDVMIGG